MIEIGCGQGFLLEKFKIQNKYGIEPSIKASGIASQTMQIRNIGFEEINNIEIYDFVFSYCVIEHVENPKVFLDKANLILNGGGLCV
jgi:2-polyprenyl-3-methyl-5-hydroxy-6-metoxy-1,4-benzoquinol methylase